MSWKGYEFEELIKQMPVNEHSEKVLLKKWIKDENGELYDCLKKSYNINDVKSISRLEIKQDAEDNLIQNFLIKSLLWGYPNGRMNVRKINLDAILSEELIGSYQKLRKSGNISWNNNGFEFLKFNGLGLSTVSKFLYFLDVKIQGFSPLILDNQIIDRLTNSNFKTSIFDKLTYDKGPKFYIRYLEFMENVSVKMKVKPENTEMFLFLFGKML
jgi:hypothetical protein